MHWLVDHIYSDAMDAIYFSINGLDFFLKEKPKLHHRCACVILSFFTIISTTRKIDITFQNEDDLSQFTERTTLRQASIHLIRGSGVDTDQYQKTDLPKDKVITFGMASRMIRMKGALDIITAFQRLTEAGVPVRLKLAGDIDEGNPDSLKADEISGLCCDGQIEWLGYQSNIKEFWNDCHVAMLGSHGGEGLPMSLLWRWADRSYVRTQVETEIWLLMVKMGIFSQQVILMPSWKPFA